MSSEKSLENFSRFARAQYETETKVWVYLFAAISVFFGAMNWVDGAANGFSNYPFTESQLFWVLMMPVALFVFLYVLRLVSLFVWYAIIFWALRRFPSLRREKFSAGPD